MPSKRTINAISDYEFLTDISKRLKDIRDDIDSRDNPEEWKRMITIISIATQVG